MTAFDSKDFENYKSEAKEKWGHTEAFREHQEKTKNFTGQKWNSLAEEMDVIMLEFAECKRCGETPDSAVAQTLVKKLLFITALLFIFLSFASCKSLKTDNNIMKEDETDMLIQKKRITSFEIITVKESGMRSTDEYEIVCDGEVSVLSHYALVPIQGTYDDERVLQNSTEWKTSEVVELMNSCNFASWNGFDGPHPKNVSDGIMFRLDAVIDDGKKIHAEGSENFPKNYKIFMGEVRSKLAE